MRLKSTTSTLCPNSISIRTGHLIGSFWRDWLLWLSSRAGGPRALDPSDGPHYSQKPKPNKNKKQIPEETDPSLSWKYHLGLPLGPWRSRASQFWARGWKELACKVLGILLAYLVPRGRPFSPENRCEQWGHKMFWWGLALLSATVIKSL